MTTTLLRASDRASVPWKNGGGLTQEIAIWPPGSDFDTFEWRVSMAQVRADGPFSRFGGVDRNLTILEGGVRLAIQDVGVFELSPQSEPLAFDGEAPASAELTGGPVLDLNVMTRRGAASARVARLISCAEFSAGSEELLIFALADGVRVHQAGEIHDLRRHDGLLTKAAIRIEASAEAPAITIELIADPG